MMAVDAVTVEVDHGGYASGVLGGFLTSSGCSAAEQCIYIGDTVEDCCGDAEMGLFGINLENDVWNHQGG